MYTGHESLASQAIYGEPKCWLITSIWSQYRVQLGSSDACNCSNRFPLAWSIQWSPHPKTGDLPGQTRANRYRRYPSCTNPSINRAEAWLNFGASQVRSKQQFRCHDRNGVCDVSSWLAEECSRNVSLMMLNTGSERLLTVIDHCSPSLLAMLPCYLQQSLAMLPC